MRELDYSFSGLESKTKTLHVALTNVSSSARGLHETVDDAAARIANMVWFGAIPGELVRLGWLVLAVAVLHRFSPRHAKFVVGILGEF